MRMKLPDLAGHHAWARRLAAVSVVAFVFAAVAVTLAVTTAGADDGASPAATSTADAGKTILRIGWTTDPDNLNPFIGMETTTQEIFTLNYDYLTDFDPATLGVRRVSPRAGR